MAYLSTIITNIARKVHGEKGVKMTVPLDFMPEWGKEEYDEEEYDTVTKPKRQTVEEMEQIMLTIARIQNKKIGAKRRNKLKKKR